MADRLGKAKAIYNEGRVYEIQTSYRSFVVTGDSGKDYEVKLYNGGGMHCTCPDRAEFCKHKLAVMELVNNP